MPKSPLPVQIDRLITDLQLVSGFGNGADYGQPTLRVVTVPRVDFAAVPLAERATYLVIVTGGERIFVLLAAQDPVIDRNRGKTRCW